MSWARFGGTVPSDLASWAITGRVAERRDDLLAGPRSRRRAPRCRRRVDAEAPLRIVAEQRALRRVRRADGERDLDVGRQLARGRRPVTAALWHVRAAPQLAAAAVAAGARRGGVGRAERLLEPAQRVAQLEQPEGVAQLRAVGLLARRARRGRGRAGCRAWRSPAAWRGARRRRARSGSACAWRRRSRRRWSSTVSSEPKRCSSSAAVLSPIPGTPGMLSLVSPLRPMKSGTSSGGIP